MSNKPSVSLQEFHAQQSRKATTSHNHTMPQLRQHFSKHPINKKGQKNMQNEGKIQQRHANPNFQACPESNKWTSPTNLFLFRRRIHSVKT